MTNGSRVRVAAGSMVLTGSTMTAGVSPATDRAPVSTRTSAHISYMPVFERSALQPRLQRILVVVAVGRRVAVARRAPLCLHPLDGSVTPLLEASDGDRTERARGISDRGPWRPGLIGRR